LRIARLKTHKQSMADLLRLAVSEPVADADAAVREALERAVPEYRKQ
jgi:hypothetical protein